jgi:hypothetical protein
MPRRKNPAGQRRTGYGCWHRNSASRGGIFLDGVTKPCYKRGMKLDRPIGNPAHALRGPNPGVFVTFQQPSLQGGYSALTPSQLPY